MDDEMVEKLREKMVEGLTLLSLTSQIAGIQVLAAAMDGARYWEVKNDDNDPDPYLAITVETNITGLAIPIQIGDLADVAEHVAICTQYAKDHWGEAPWNGALDQALMAARKIGAKNREQQG